MTRCREKSPSLNNTKLELFHADIHDKADSPFQPLVNLPESVRIRVRTSVHRSARAECAMFVLGIELI